MNIERRPLVRSNKAVIIAGARPKTLRVLRVPALPVPCSRISMFFRILPKRKEGEIDPTTYPPIIKTAQIIRAIIK